MGFTYIEGEEVQGGVLVRRIFKHAFGLPIKINLHIQGHIYSCIRQIVFMGTVYTLV